VKTASTKYHGLIHLWTGTTFIQDICASFIRDPYLKEELIAESYLYISELPEDKFLTLFNSGQLRYFCYGMCRNQIRSTSSKFYRSHIRPGNSDELNQTHEKTYVDLSDKKERMDIINEAVDTLDFYHKEMFKLYYLDNMSLMDISNFTAKKNAFTRIPKSSVFHAVKTARREVSDYIRKNYPDAFDERI
jgi:hypothetical protein